MSISAYTGLPGSGKSYSVVANVIRRCLEDGREVVTNIPLNLEECYRRYSGAVIQQVANCDLGEPGFFDALPGGSVVVIDELWRLWPSGQKSNGVPEEQKSFLAEHRHRVGDNGKSMEVVLVTQDLAQVASWVRQLVEVTYRMLKLSDVGMANKFRTDVYRGGVTGQRPPESARLRQFFQTYDSVVFALYQSHTQSDTGFAGEEGKVDRRANLLGKVSIKYGIVVGLIVMVLAGWQAYRFLSGGSVVRSDDHPKEVSPSPASAPGPIQPRYPKIPVKPSSPAVPPDDAHPTWTAPRSQEWRLVGVIRAADDGGQGRSLAVVTDGSHLRRIPLDGRCRDQFELNEWQCVLDGELISAYTGRAMVAGFGGISSEVPTTSDVATHIVSH